ncbi:MAG: efflux RND transporter periplasmic adaptor subunit [Roseiflexaceae bacterium]
MATVPQSRPQSRFPRPSLPMLIAIILVIAAVVGLVVPRLTSSTPAVSGPTATVTRGPLVAGIIATGEIEPRAEANLVFNTREGRVADVLVQEGDVVEAGTPLIALDSREQAAQVAAAKAALDQANADLQALNDGATPEEIAAARAQVAAAQGNLQQTLGSVTASDIAAARAQVDEARARLRALTGTPNSDDLTRAEAAVAQAQATLDQQRSSLSAAKEQARQQVEAAANILRNAQTEYAAARDNLSSVESDSKDPLTGAPLTDAGERSYRDAFLKAERAMLDAEASLNQAKIAYENARQAEITGLADAEARLRSSQADLDALKNPSNDTVASARAQLANAEAALGRLLGDQRSGAVAAQEATLAQAQANLDQLLADPKSSDLARAQAQVAQAQANLDLAQIRFDETTLRAPFAGIVARINVTAGEDISQTAPITLIDVSTVQVKVTVDEVDVAKVTLGQQVDVLIDALGAPTLNGKVIRIGSLAEPGSEVTAYEVLVEVNPGERIVKPGMTASATIVTDRRESALNIPASAVRTANGVSTVTVITTGSNGQQQATERTITIGGTFGDKIEVVDGLNEGDIVKL